MVWFCKMIVATEAGNDGVVWPGKGGVAVVVELAGANTDTSTVNVMIG